ncbi:MAG: hypothetical protein E6Q83_05685 [Thiothrix sp.]|nr:MAG: hypothetical protein E6Q83_05685 [Thiothrix sp.]
MNNIGFTTTNNTAVANNTSTPAANNLSALAANFSGANSMGTAFNSLILSLFIQIIQALLKNMPNKPCCDQPTKPQTLSLSDAEKTKLADALSTDGKTVTILSVEDSDKSGKLSVGDKINLQRPTGQLDAQDKPILESVSVTLTQEQLDRYQTPTPQTLSLTSDQLLQLQNGELIHWRSADSSKLQITDNDNSGNVSKGDTLSVPVRASNNVDIYQWKHELTNDEAQAINGNYGKTLGNYTSPALTSSDLSTNPISEANEALAKALNLNTTDGAYLRVVFDKDGNGKLSEGDIAVIDYHRAEAAIGNPPPKVATGPYIELSADVVAAATKQDPSNQLSLSNAEKNKLFEIITLGRNYINTPSLVNVIDSDHNGALSVGDQMNFKAFSGREDELTGEPIFNYWTEALTTEQLNDYQSK